MKLKPVNLIPKGDIKSSPLNMVKAFVSQNSFLVKSLLFGLFVLLLFIFTPTLIINKNKADLVLTKHAIEQTKVTFKKFQSENLQAQKLKNELAKEEASAKQQLLFLVSTLSMNRKYAKLILSIAQILPADLWLSRIIMDENEAQISGSAVSSQLVAEFMNKLESSKDFRNSRFISTEKQVAETHTVYNFQIAAEPGWSLKKTVAPAAKPETKKEK